MQCEGLAEQGGGGRSLPDAGSVLLPGMRLLARLTSAEPGLALALAQLQLPADSGGEADLLSLLASGLSLQRGPAGLSDAEALQLYGKMQPCCMTPCRLQLPAASRGVPARGAFPKKGCLHVHSMLPDGFTKPMS